ncbi:MAG: SMC-Scp complex subunit ScpB [Ignavibacteria bacterium]|nr:SMC-Scp complex subunit ScpB [Ignavibacteria bacterium]
MMFFYLDYEVQKRIVESLIFASEEPISIVNLTEILTSKIDFSSMNLQSNFQQSPPTNEIDFEKYFKKLIEDINQELRYTLRPYQIIFVAGGYTFATTEEYGKIISLLPSFRYKKRLSRAMLEVLTIIAYNQPITRPEIENIRGTNSAEVINSLLEKNLIKVVGRKNVPGKPHLFATTNDFLKLFGLGSLEELPKYNEIRTLVEERDKQEKIELKIDFNREDLES